MINQIIVEKAKKKLLEMHFESGVGHIGGNLSALDAILVVFHEFLALELGDHFILSKGHSAGALYVALWSRGLLSDEDLLLFHKDGTLLGGHPPAHGIDAIPFATGSLGHGLSLAAGTALANKIKGVSSKTYCLMSDGEFQEGSTWEAIIFLAHHALTSLTVLIDNNQLQGFGSTIDIASMSNLYDRLQGFNVEIFVIPGHDLDAIRDAITVDSLKPKFIILNTVKGHGISFMENKMEWHYLPLNRTQYLAALSELDG